MLVACWSIKGGSGTTVVAAALAAMLARRSPEGAVLADLAGDGAAVLGLPEPGPPGLAGWLSSGADVPADALARLEVPAGRGLTLLPRGVGPLAAPRARVLAGVLDNGSRPVVADCGVLARPAEPLAWGAASGPPAGGDRAPGAGPDRGSRSAAARWAGGGFVVATGSPAERSLASPTGSAAAGSTASATDPPAAGGRTGRTDPPPAGGRTVRTDPPPAGAFASATASPASADPAHTTTRSPAAGTLAGPTGSPAPGALTGPTDRPASADPARATPRSPAAGTLAEGTGFGAAGSSACSSEAAQALVSAARRSILVTRPCYLALRRAHDPPLHPTAVVVVHEPGRALGRAEIERIVSAPVVAEIAIDPAVARAVDAGLLASRLPRSLERSLRHAA